MFKKLFLSLCLAVILGGISSAAQISIDPVFSDARFEPNDKLHAGCINTATVSLKTAKEDINNLRFIISYEPEKVQVLDIKAASGYKDILDTTIEYDKVIVSLLDAALPNNDTTKLFTLSFKSSESATETSFAVRKPSYVMTKTSTKIPVFADQKISFAKVPECEPDIIPPTISLVKPKTTDNLLSLDSYFVFDIKDMGKGINKDSLRLRFNGKTYTGSDPVFTWQDNYLAFLPNEWIPIGTALNLTITIGDKQVYGNANTTKKTFTFVSTTGIQFEHTFTPEILRNMLGKMESIYATNNECDLLSGLLLQNNSSITASLLNLSKKIGCTLSEPIAPAKVSTTKAKPVLFISVFASIGWILFSISFLLKLHYLLSAKKHKKLSKTLQSYQSR